MTRFRDTFEFMNDERRERDRFGDSESNSITCNADVKSDLIDIDIVIHHGTSKALLVALTNDRSTAVWIPKSQIEIEHKTQLVMGENHDGRTVQLATATITLPKWLAKAKGLA